MRSAWTYRQDQAEMRSVGPGHLNAVPNLGKAHAMLANWPSDTLSGATSTHTRLCKLKRAMIRPLKE